MSVLQYPFFQKLCSFIYIGVLQYDLRVILRLFITSQLEYLEFWSDNNIALNVCCNYRQIVDILII